MIKKPLILLIEASVQVIDDARRESLAQKYDFVHYDCDSTADFIKQLQPDGAYHQIDGIIRTGWLKAGRFANQLPFATEVVNHFPPSLKIVCCTGHGHDAADVDLMTRKGIIYCNTPNACTEAVANTALSLVLDTFRYLTYAGWCARYDWFKSRELGLKAVDPTGKALGILGMGSIGLEVARKCKAAFDMDIHYSGPKRKENALGAKYHSDLNEMIKEVDCIVVAAPYTQDTHHVLSREQFQLAKSSGLRIVNIARGMLIDEEAMIDALEEGKVVGVGLDVHYSEPEVNPRLRDNWMVTLLPHIGVCSQTSWENFEKQNWDNLEAYFATGKPNSPVNMVAIEKSEAL